MKNALFIAPFLCYSLAAAIAQQPLVELKTSSGSYRGRVVAKDDRFALLLDRDGTMNGVALASVTNFSVAEPTFRPYLASDLRSRLKDLVGRDANVFASRHFVVAGRPEAAKAAGLALEEIHGEYRYFCATHNLPLTDPEFPLVALVLPNAETFAAYCRTDGVGYSPSLAGYYDEETNRFVCYERGSTRDDPIAGVRDTLTHEAVHQLAFNTGLHSRMGSHPTWVVEGLATVLEPEGVRRRFNSQRTLDRVNPERFYRLLQMIGPNDPVRVQDLVATDQPFNMSPLPSYATAWAMTFYLLETRPADYLRYLRILAARPPLAEYDAAAREADFKAAFGTNIPTFERSLANSMRQIAQGAER